MSGTCCCGWCPLGKGTLAIGIFYIIVHFHSIVENGTKIISLIGTIYYSNAQPALNSPQGDTASSAKEQLAQHLVLIIPGVVSLILSCVMVHGYRMKSM
ncbi:uncharacterized protein LOC110859716 isoform X2 [Folsomia candida]|uniref:uncharacterized protein LOC110859716 isoform X2 n=1 Tax=Folsomia candida TaxID=158441 RepID=UPI0016051751|nr:uncharacterized protein LOC110859716 isoform X2 [Folsomia candida]